MSREIRSRRAGLSRDQSRQQPLYARLLGLQYLMPSGFLCFVFLEGAVALGILLALAELVSWWGVLVLPVTVAAMVKLNDVVAGAVSRPGASVPRTPAMRTPVGESYWESGDPDAASWDNFAGDASETRTFPAVPASSESPESSGSFGEPAVLTLPAEILAPVVRRAAMQTATVDLRKAAARTRTALNAVDASSLNGPPVARQWAFHDDQLDNQEQWSRQAARRRYE